MLSNYCRNTAGKYNIKVCVLKKLVPNSGNKTNYIVYYINLQLYLTLRIKLIKFHRVLKFKQLIGSKNNILANQLLFPKKLLVKILLLFME